MEEQNYCYKYPRPAVTTDCLVFGYDKDGLSILLIQRGGEPYKGCWAFPGGFLEMDEDAETGALRELKEETGFETKAIEQFGTFTSVHRDPRGRVITIAYYALVHKGEVKGGDDAVDARWFPIDQLPQLAFDHEHIFRVAMSTLKEKIHFNPIVFDLLPSVFTMSQVQTLYESILDMHFDRRNFAAKIVKLGIVTPIEDIMERAHKRAPVKYRFNAERYKQMKAEGTRFEF